MNDVFQNYYDILRGQLEERFEHWQHDITDDDVTDFSCYDLAEFIKKHENFYLYQYRRADYYSIRNLETQKIYLTPNGKFNDVFEGLPTGKIEDYNRSNTSALFDLALVSCFSETNNNELMWSHYADSHKGFCVQYDLNLLNDDPFHVVEHTFPVVYSKERIINYDISELVDLVGELREAINNNYEFKNGDYFNQVLPLLLRKSLCWNYEKEWRIIYTIKQIYDYYDECESDVNYSMLRFGILPFSCASGVYIGYRIGKEIREHLIEICNRLSERVNREIPVYAAYLSNDSYDILFDKV